MPTRQATPGPSTSVLPLQTTNKRGLSPGDGDASNARKKIKSEASPTNKGKKRRKRKKKTSIVMTALESERPRSKSRSATASTQPIPATTDTQTASVQDTKTAEDLPAMEAVETDAASSPRVDKGKGKAREESSPPLLSLIESPEAQIARLTQELESQRLLLQRHQTHLSQIHQSLTCQICLDLLHKPFALAPCGHIACHPCLIRWFTNSDEGSIHTTVHVEGQNGASHIHKKKKCPICRTVIVERPVEVWGVKGMVSSVVRSGLVELPAPPPAVSTSDDSTHGPNAADPWHNIFRRVNSRRYQNLYLPEPPADGERGGQAEMGMYDVEDGGIYRCIDCMHEIWSGTCTGCQRVYPGHQHDDDGDDGEPDRSLNRRMVRDFFSMISRTSHFDDGESDDDEDISLGVFGEDDEDEDDIEEADDILSASHSILRRLNGVPPMHAPLQPAIYHNGMAYADFTAEFTEDEEEAGIARIEEEGEDEEGYESSFIDDDGGAGASGRVRLGYMRDIIELEDGSSSDEEIVRRPRHPSRTAPRRRIASSDPIIAGEGEDGDGDDAADEEVARLVGRQFRLQRHRPVTRPHPAVVIDSDDEELPSSPEIQAPRRRSRAAVAVQSSDEEGAARRRSSRTNTIPIEDDSDHEEVRASFGVYSAPFEDDGHEHTSSESGNENELDSEEKWYDEDGSVPGPSSRLLRLMDNGADSLDESGASSDDSERW